MNPEILVTAANGNTGYPAAKELLNLGVSVRAFVRNPNTEKAKTLKKLGAEIFVGDIEDIRDVRKALENVIGAYFVPTYPNVLFQGTTFATAVEEMKTEYVVVLTQWLSSNSHPSVYTKEHWLVDQTFKRAQHTKVTFLNPGLFAFAYFLTPAPILQLGMLPDFGENAPPSNEDIGLVAAHILKDPSGHTNKTYRVTGRDLLTSKQMAETATKVLGRKVEAKKLPEKLMLKMFRSLGFPQIDASQLRYYIKDGYMGGFGVGTPTTTVHDIVGKEADDFETIVHRYLVDHPMMKKSVMNKLKTMRMMMKAMFTSSWDMKKFEEDYGLPKFKNMKQSIESDEWKQTHVNTN